MFIDNYPVVELKPAPYNPRRIDDSAFCSLISSVIGLGVAKPIIVNNKTQTIIAGHQRLRVLQELGYNTAPVYIIDNVSITAEMRFNQIHNGTDMDTADEDVRVPVTTRLGYTLVNANDIFGNQRASGVPVRAEICKLLSKYGAWGGIVATQAGECLSGAQYALACLQLGYPVLVYYVPTEQRELVRLCFQQQYGTFCYDNLKRETYIQTFAQPYRIRNSRSGAGIVLSAPTWTEHVMPDYQPGERILDFGCGHAQYLQKLQREHYPADGLEFFYHSGNTINTNAVHTMIRTVCTRIRTVGRYDVVVADYVLNSVDSAQSEHDVLYCLFALAKPGAKIYFTGRRRDTIERAMRSTRRISHNRGIEFLDLNGLSAIEQHGHWFFQKYIDKPDVFRLISEHFTVRPENIRYTQNDNQWQVRVIKDGSVIPNPQLIEDAIRREFNLPWPNGHTVNRAEYAVSAWKTALTIENTTW